MSQQLPLFSSKKPAPITEKAKPAQQIKPWHHLPFLCVDVETTGLDPASNRVIEVAWIMFEKEEEVFSDSRLCSIDIPLPSMITDLTGIKDEMLKDQPPFAEHADDLLKAMAKAEFIVAYNANFDRNFLNAEMSKIDKSMPEMPWIDPCVFIREIDRYQKGKRLQDATERWNVSLKGAHRALADATATGLLLYKLERRLKSEFLPELIDNQNQWQKEQEKQYKAYAARKQMKNRH